MSLGAHLVGTDVAELLPEFTLAQRWDLTVKELVGNVHTHSTLSEAQQGNVSWPGRKDDQLLEHSRSILTASAKRAAQLRTRSSTPGVSCTEQKASVARLRWVRAGSCDNRNDHKTFTHRWSGARLSR